MSRRSVSGSSSSGVGFFGLLGIAFIVLKLVGVIDWPWLWVLSPIWGGCLLGIVVLVIVLLVVWLLD